MTAAEKPPVSERLRALIIAHAVADTLTCPFKPGGKFGGVGIRSHLYCANCRQGIFWHVVAEGLAEIATAEEIIRSSGHVAVLGHRIDAFVAGVEVATELVTVCHEIIQSAGDPAEEDVRHG